MVCKTWMKTNACVSSLAEVSLESAKWKLKFISAYFRRSFSFKNNDRTCGSLWTHLTHLKVMNVTVLFKQLMVLNNTLYLFFLFFISCCTDLRKAFFVFCMETFCCCGYWLLSRTCCLGNIGCSVSVFLPFLKFKNIKFQYPGVIDLWLV